MWPMWFYASSNISTTTIRRGGRGEEKRSKEEERKLGTPKAQYELLEREGCNLEAKKDRRVQ